MPVQSLPLPDIRSDIERVSTEVVSKAARFAAAILADVAGRRGAMNRRICALSPSMKVAGPAVTVEVRPGDNLMVHAALAIAKARDVLVADGKADRTSALTGVIMATQAKEMGIAGFIIDAAVRDVWGWPVCFWKIGVICHPPTI